LIKETRITEVGVEFEMYVQPTNNIWFKYRQKPARRGASRPPLQTVRVGIPQSHSLNKQTFSSTEAAAMLGIGVDVLRLRIKLGKYPAPPRSDGNHRVFTIEHVQKIRALS
jgi:hypothetical protein